MSQPGRISKLTREQVLSVREAYRLHKLADRQRRQLCAELDITMQYFCNVGRGVAGKKPRVET